MSAHAKLSASGAHRWMVCPGSVEAEVGYPDTQSEHAKEGSAAHWVAEQCLNKIVNAWNYVGTTVPEFDVLITEEMAEQIQVYLDYVRGLGGTPLVEVRVDFSNVVPEGFGTSDFVTMVDNTLYIVDLKFGRGLKVMAENNPQAMLYAIGVLNEYGAIYEPEHIVIAIVQPRLDHIDEWEITYEQLLQFAREAQEKATLALTPNAPRNPDEKACNWCKAKAECPALAAYVEEAIGQGFDNLDETHSVAKLSLDQVSKVIKAKKLITAFIDAAEKLATERLQRGDPMPGFKLVEGRSARSINDEAKAAAMLLDIGFSQEQIYKPVALKGITDLEKLVGKKEFSRTLGEMIVKPTGAPTLAPIDDPRAPLTVASAADFA